ncbi:MAG TPA: cation:proton antiporter [bacterium]|nr:cation:proton antiporter [bacterium]
MRFRIPAVSAIALVLMAAPVAWGATADGPGDSIPAVLIALAVIMVGAKLGGALAQRAAQPAVLGELLFGVMIGNLALVGLDWFEPLSHLATIHVLAEIGVIILLFEVGLESDLGQMMRVGLSSFLVATLGVVGPFLLGWGVGIWFYPEESEYMHAFLGAILTATSVGITARVLKDINKIDTDESRIILGAAVIDDVLGLLILAVVSGIIQAADAGQSMSSAAILWLIAKAVLFLTGAIVIGRMAYKPLFRVANYLRVHGMLLITSLAACFVTAFVAAKVGLAPIVGAFAAGLVLDEVHYREQPNLGRHSLEEVMEPLVFFLVPIFFVKMGMDVDLATFGRASVLGFALILTLAAIIGKQISSFGVVHRPGVRSNRWIVGLGMVPRGEVGLIFAGIGATLVYQGHKIVLPEVYSAVVIMVILTTLVTPPVLTWSFRKFHRGAAGSRS